MTTEKELLATTDAQVWAKAFVEMHGGDEELLFGWFANAMQTAENLALKPRTPASTDAESAALVAERLREIRARLQNAYGPNEILRDLGDEFAIDHFHAHAPEDTVWLCDRIEALQKRESELQARVEFLSAIKARAKEVLTKSSHPLAVETAFYIRYGVTTNDA